MLSTSFKPYFFIFIFLYFSQFGYSQILISSEPIAAISGFGSVKGVVQGLYAAQGNQAGLSSVTEMGIYAGASTRFVGTGIRNVDIGFVMPIAKSGAFSISAQQFGIAGYKEQKIGLGYGRKLLKNLSLGAQIDYLNLNNEEFGASSIITFEIGLMADLLPNLRLGLHTYNPLGVKINNDEKLPAIVELAFGYKVGPKFDLNAAIEKDIDKKERIKGGIEYKPTNSIAFRTGFRTAPFDFSFGIGYSTKNGLGIDFASGYHQTLGFSPGLSLAYRFVSK